MLTNEQIKKQTQQVAKLERKLALEKIKRRKAETRRKIEFGGLVVKAKMDEYSKDIILGALLDVKEQIEADEGARALFKSKGEAAFMEYNNTKDEDNGNRNPTQ